MNQTYIKKIGLTLLATLACGAAFAQSPAAAPAYSGPIRAAIIPPSTDAIIYTNLGNYLSSDGNGTMCQPCTYDSGNGYLILATANCFGIANAQSVSYSWVPGKTAKVRTAQVAVTLDAALCTPVQKRFDVVLYSDACGGPFTELARKTVLAPAAPCGIATANFGAGGPTVTAGQTYWIACEPVKTCLSTDDHTSVWWNSFRGTAWFSFTCPAAPYTDFFPSGAPGGFQINS